MKPIFSVPKLKSYDDLSKTWYIWFRYNGQLIKKTGDINRLKDSKSRTIAGNALAKVYHEKLKEGWNPNTPVLQVNTQINYMTFTQALDFSMEKKKSVLSHKSYLDYSCTVRFCKVAAEQIGLASIYIHDVKMLHIKLVMEKAMALNKWSGKGYNKHLCYLKSILSELIQWEIIEHSPAVNVKYLKVLKERANIPPDKEQLDIIKETVLNECPDFWDFILVIYHTGIRPGEITYIQDKMIDRNKRLIILPPTITKTPKERIVPINNHLWDILEPRIGFGRESYLFGTTSPHRGYKKGSRMFVPSPLKLYKATPTREWGKIVKKGLGLDVNLYSMKKAGANDKIMAGMSRRALKEIFGHSSELTTEIYITNLQEVLHKEIMAIAPTI